VNALNTDEKATETTCVEVCAVVVTYFPGFQCAENLVSIADQVKQLIIVDNGSTPECFSPVEHAARRLDAIVVKLERNLGIAAALNIGLRFANAHGFRWLATFDQDSRLPQGMIQEMFRVLGSHPDTDKVAIIAARVFDENTGFEYTLPGDELLTESWRALRLAITSGNLVNVPTALAVGGFDESLFIDLVDFEFCIRLRNNGFIILEARRAKLLHSIGRLQFRRFFFLRVLITNHSPIRRYYIARNQMILCRKYWKVETAWVLRNIFHFLPRTMWIFLYEKQPIAKFSMTLRGIIDGARNVRGAYVPRQ
jgi:rhamnosyltransferase